MAYVDPKELLYVILTSDAALVSEVSSGGRVHIYGPPGLPPDYVIRKSVLYMFEGSGDADLHIPKRTKFAEIRCYGVDAAEAEAVFGKVYNVLHRRAHERVSLSNGTAIFQFSGMSGEAADMIEPQTDWPFVRAVFEFQFAEHTV